MSLKDMIGDSLKAMISIKGSKAEWNSVTEAWRKMKDTADIRDHLQKAVGIASFCMKREALELVKFGKMDHLKPLVSDKDTSGCTRPARPIGS